MTTNLHDVVFTVNHVYVAIVSAVIAAKSQPNLYVCKPLSKSTTGKTPFNAYQYTTNEGNFEGSGCDTKYNGLNEKSNPPRVL